MANKLTYKVPDLTYTVDQFIACQSNDEPSYYNYAFKDEIFYNFYNRYIRYTTYNTIWDYLDDIREDYCKYHVVLSDDEMAKYMYKPKLFAYDVYSCAELGPMILLLNDMYSVRQFTKNKLELPNSRDMNEITEQLFNANQKAIMAYNS